MERILALKKKHCNSIPSGGSFSYFVSLEVLNTPFIFTAATIDQGNKIHEKYLKITLEYEDGV